MPLSKEELQKIFGLYRQGIEPKKKSLKIKKRDRKSPEDTGPDIPPSPKPKDSPHQEAAHDEVNVSQAEEKVAEIIF